MSDPPVAANNVPPLMVTAPVERFVPLVPPVVTDTVPALMVVPPEYVLAPVRVVVPAPI